MERKQDCLDEIITISGDLTLRDNYNKELLYKLKGANKPIVKDKKRSWVSDKTLGLSFLTSGIIIMFSNNMNIEVISALENSRDMMFKFVHTMWR